MAADTDLHETSAVPLAHTPLHALHVALGARMVAFAGYEMPVQYPAGILAEHTHTRNEAGLFDVSHMGQAFLLGGRHEAVARVLEALCPADILGLDPGRQRYSQLTSAGGTILDDFMVARSADPAEDGVLMLVVNAATKAADFSHIEAQLPAEVRLLRADHRALLALQGPRAAEVLARHCPRSTELGFMEAATAEFDGVSCHISRSGYTGEDGFEISIRADRAESIARTLLAEAEVKPIGLGARDSLRLEAGLCLYGHDIDTTTTPVEAGLVWSIGKRRRAEGGFPGADRVRLEIANGVGRRLVGLMLDGKVPAREGADIKTPEGILVGRITSGGFSPTLGRPIAMGYVEAAYATPTTALELIVRGKPLAARVVSLPFVPHRYHKKPRSPVVEGGEHSAG
jgi:aminomethyltransferase